MTIPLPTLPEWSKHDDLDRMVPSEIRGEIRAIQREAMRAALQAATQVCRDFHATDSLSNYGLVLARMIDELEVES